MDKKQLIEMIEAVAYEKTMPLDRVRAAMEDAIAALARREAKPDDGIFNAQIEDDGTVITWRTWEYVDVVENTATQREATKNNPAGTEVDEDVPEPKWTRQGLQIVKQVLYQRLREGLRKTVAEKWDDRQGEIVIGTIKRKCKGGWIVDLGEPAEGVLAGRDMIPNETLRIGHRIRALVKNVNSDGNGPAIVLSRTDDDFLRQLIATEVPEVGMGMVIIHAIAREPGQRAKVAVGAGQGLRNSPTGTCVGMRGIRAQTVSNEINGERLDFVEWNENMAQYLVSSMAPGEIERLVLDENSRSVLMGIQSEKLGRAIGGGGQNIRLAAKLTGWKIEAMSLDDLDARIEKDNNKAAETLAELLDLDMDIARVLVEENFHQIEDIAYCQIAELLIIDGVDDDIAVELQSRAKDAILNREIAQAEEDVAAKPATLSDLEGISEEDVALLEGQGINTLSALADCGIMDVMWNEDRDDELGSWILAAREATEATQAA